jgi:methyl-accepting chemotaxis protein
VVATEMRNLSHSSAKLNEQIRVQVEQSKKIVHETRDVVNQMAMRDMSSLIEAKDHADILFAKLGVMNEYISENLGQVPISPEHRSQRGSGGAIVAVRGYRRPVVDPR